jgi:serine protease Do
MVVRLTRPMLAALVVAMLAAATVDAQEQTAPRPKARTRVQSAAPLTLPTPDGWLGIYYICETETWANKGELFVKHLGYPQVASVEPGSPAFRAGIEAGDTILAYNAIDLKGRTVSLTKLLKPGTKLEVRVKRAKETYDLPVTVARRVAYGPGVVGSPGMTVVRPERARMAVGSGADPVVAPVPPVDAVTPTAPTVLYGRLPLAGAELARINPDLGQPFGVERGVLVLQVVAHTPAARAGLRSGDVIIAVNGNEVVTPAQVQRALAKAADERSVKLTLIRKRKPVSTLLVWSEP